MMLPPLDRRTVLRGACAAVALPFLEAMSLADGAAAEDVPRRLAFLYVPNGIHMQDWLVEPEGEEMRFGPTLAPLEELRGHVSVLSGLTADKARANGDGPGDHARAAAAFLTGAQPAKTSGAGIRVGISADQLAAREIGAETRLPSLELGCEGARHSGQCDSGYACVYSTSISWQTARSARRHDVRPAHVFDRLFAGGDGLSEEERLERARKRRSLLDFVIGDAKRLKRRLGATDRHKVDEYFDAVRELERRIDRVLEGEDEHEAPGERPAGKPKDYGEHLKLMSDLLVLAFQTDSTRIATFMLANEGSNRSYNSIGVSGGHHSLSHHRDEPEKVEAIRKINRYHVEHLAYLLGRMRDVEVAPGTSLLDQSLLVYGSGISDGNRHWHHDLPMLLCGGGGGSLTPGRHLKYERETPATNLYLALLARMGVHASRLGDSTGVLDLS